LIGDIINVEMKLKGNFSEAKQLSATNGGCLVYRCCDVYAFYIKQYDEW
jgi:hypothetical protein